MKQLFYYLVILLLPCSIIAQDLPQVVPPSPTVANLMQFEEVPVSYYTGQPNISIPIYSKALTGDLALNIGLSYNTQSIKINNRSGWTGTGWSLNAGGVVSRTVRGIPDEWPKNSGLITGEGALHIDDFWNFDTLNPSEREEFLWNAAGTPGDNYDTESDLFQFNALGITGRFVLVKENNAVVAKLLSKNQNFKIDIDYHPTTYALNKFTITDTNGYVYTFDVIETLHAEPFNATEYFNGQYVYSGQDDDYTYTSSWHLSKVEMPNSVNGSHTLVDFTYQTFSEAYTASVTRTENRPFNPPYPTWNDYMAVDYNNTVMKPRNVHSYYTMSGGTKKLSRITFRDNTYIDFIVSSTINHPETNGKALEYIRIKDASNVENKHFRLVYDSNLSNRLWLNQVKEVAGGITNNYTLDYNDKFSLPAFDTVSATDDWGYNIAFAPGGACDYPKPDPTAIQKGLLSRITYPTGGTKDFEFERHTITYQGNTQLSDDEYRDQNPDNWNSISLNLNFNSATDNSAQSNVVPETFTISQPQTLVYKKISTTASPQEQFNAYIEVTGPNNYRDVFRLNEDEVIFALDTAGTYEVRFFTLTIGTNYNYQGCISYKSFVSNIKRYIYGGGVRIKRVIFKDLPNDPQNQKDILYTYDDANGQNRSSGSIDGLLTGLFKKHTEWVTRFLIPANCPLDSNLISFQFEVCTRGLNAELTQGQYIGYKTVKMQEAGNGYSTFTYSSAQDHYSGPSTFIYPYAPADDIDFKRGLLEKSEVFAQDGKKLKESNNTYSFIDDTIAPNYRIYSNDCEWKQFYNFYASAVAKSPDNPMTVCFGGSLGLGLNDCGRDCITLYDSCFPNYFMSNDVKSSWARLDETISKDYYYDASNNQSIKETRQVFTYNNFNYQVSIQDSYYDIKGVDEHLQTKYFYPVGGHLGSNSAGVVSALLADNKVNEVLEIQSYRNGTKLNETHNIYADFDVSSQTLMLPKEVKVGKYTITPEKRIEFIKYDGFGNPLEVKKSNGSSICYLYGFNSSVPIAKIANATYSTVAGLFGNNTNFSGNLNTSQENSIRNLSNVLASFYRYDPIVGVISTADEKGYEMSYEYDEFNRLKRVIDEDGKILSENTYHYKGQ